MHDIDLGRGQADSRVESRDGGIVPHGRLAHVDAGQYVGGKFEPAITFTPLRFTTITTPPHTMGNWASPLLCRSASCNGASEAPKSTFLALDGRDAAARADGLIVELHAVGGAILGPPLADDRSSRNDNSPPTTTCRRPWAHG